MDSKDNPTVIDPEIDAIGLVFSTLSSLDTEAQIRVIEYVAGKLGIQKHFALRPSGGPGETHGPSAKMRDEAEPETTPQGPSADSSSGISPVAQKWMTRSGLGTEHLGKIFSLLGDEIDLIAESIPGESKRNRMHNVILLKGIAGYLATGAARVTHEQIKETCLHYDAFDRPNFATYLKGFSADVSGSKDSGYTLTPRGIAAATALVKQMTQAESQH